MSSYYNQSRPDYGRPPAPSSPNLYQPPTSQQLSPRMPPSPSFQSQSTYPHHLQQQYPNHQYPNPANHPVYRDNSNPHFSHLHQNQPRPGPHAPSPASQLHRQQQQQQFAQHPHYSPKPVQQMPPQPLPTKAAIDPECIKCSSCTAWVHLDDLGDHVCIPNMSSNATRREGNENGLRVDVEAAGWKPNGATRSPMYPGSSLLQPTPPQTPGTPASRPSSPSAHSNHSSSALSDQLSQSWSSSSSAASSSKMPFFERYNKLVGSGSNVGVTTTGGGDVNLAGVGMRNLTLGSPSPRNEGFPPFASNPNGINRNRSPSPNPATSSYTASPLTTNRGLPSPNPSPTIQPAQIASSFPDRRPSPNPSQSSSNSVSSYIPPSSSSSSSYHDSRETTTSRSPIPPQSPLPPAPPSRSASSNSIFRVGANASPPPGNLSRSASNSSSLHSEESAYIAYDRRETLKPSPSSHSLHSQTSRLAEGSGGIQGIVRSQSSKSVESTSSLDALEDLLLMAREEAVDDEAFTHRKDDEEENQEAKVRREKQQAMIDEFLAPSTKNASVRQDDEDELMDTPRAPPKLPSSKSTPTLAAFSSSSAYSSSSRLPTSGSTPNLFSVSTSSRIPVPKSSNGPRSPTTPTCTICLKRVPTPSDVRKGGDGQTCCQSCYAERFLPKCRKCHKTILEGAVSSSDGKVVGKYHSKCFSCFTCSKSFPTGDFYVFDGKPYCQYDYHVLNGSICSNEKTCSKPIEGPCVSLVGRENGDGGRYHPSCFQCTTCSIPLLEHHWVVDRKPYCETHSLGPSPHPTLARPIVNGKETSRAKKRQTIITRR